MTRRSIPRRINGLAEVIDRFDTFFVDQFGVLHDGHAPYPGAIEALTTLKSEGKRVVLLSNSGKRSAPNEDRLRYLGFKDECWDLFLSSGEVAWRLLQGEIESGIVEAPLSCLLIARDGDTSAVDGLPVAITSDASACDLVLIAGSEAERLSLDHYQALLAPAAARSVPAYCTNPDMTMLTPDGLRFGAGRIAELYQTLGGSVEWIGKPYPEMYRVALDIIGRRPGDRVLCIGDSIEHDIVGGLVAGFSACFVKGGIHAHDSAEEIIRQLNGVGDDLLGVLNTLYLIDHFSK